MLKNNIFNEIELNNLHYQNLKNAIQLIDQEGKLKVAID